MMTSIISNLVLCSAQISHRYAHRRNHEYKNGKKQFYIPKFIKFLQDNHLILNNIEHHMHHMTEVMYYTISNGSTNRLFDKLIDMCDLHVSTFKNSNNTHIKHINKYKHDIIKKFLNTNF